MSMGTFTRIIDQMFPYVRYLSLYYLGEPLLCEHLPQMIRYARHHKIKVCVSSNLNILGNQQADSLIESKLDYLIVSLDGTSQESYEKYRIGGDYKKVIENVRLLIDRKNEKKSLYPRLVLQAVIFRHNEHEIPKLRALADQLGLEISIRQGALGGKGQSPPVTKDSILAEKWLSPNKTYHKEYDYLSDKSHLIDDPCYFLWKAVAINWDGTVFPCCWLYDSRHSFGNILKENFETIWNNDFYRSSRSLFSIRKSTFLKSRGNGPETICYQCKIFKHHLNTLC
jgi:radical SAM protein with 4Fe4S-binding SPASM domain